MFIVKSVLLTPKWFDLYTSCHTHGWTYLAPFAWDDDRSCLEFAVSAGGVAVDISIRQPRKSLDIQILSAARLDLAKLVFIDSAINRVLSLKEDISELAEKAGRIGSAQLKLIERGAGRLLRGASLWEDAAKTLFTTNCSWALTKKMSEKMCSANFSRPAPSGRFPFPSPTRLAVESPSCLRRKLPIGYRAAALEQLAKSFSVDPSFDGLESRLIPFDTAYQKVSRLKGFGPYAATHLLILAGYYNRIPVDSEVTGFVKKNYSCRSVEKFVNRHYSCWGRFRWWGLKLEKMMMRQNWLGD